MARQSMIASNQRTLRFPDEMEVPVISIGGFLLEGDENGEIQVPPEHVEQALAHGLIDVDEEVKAAAALESKARAAAATAARKAKPRSGRPTINK